MAGWLARWLGRGNAAPEPTANDRLRAALLDQGDDGRAIRFVTHYAYPATEDAAGMKDARDAVSWIAPKCRRTEDGTGLRFVHEREVASGEFDEMTETFERDFEAIGWSYDGWDCAVVPGESR